MSDRLCSPSTPYDSHFFEKLRKGANRSAQEIVPLLLEWVQPKSVVDVGCGDGTWLSVFKAHGIEDILGIDGDYIDPEALQIPSECFIAQDLQQPIQTTRSFDLVVSLEVAEHLPIRCADPFVDSLVHLGPAILFSAAIPHQGGTHHVNEQWPSFWIRRFEQRGYVAIDALRPEIWDNPHVEPWYAQNCLLFVKNDRLSEYPELQKITSVTPLNLVHPRLYLREYGTSYLTQDIEILNISLSPGAEIATGSGLTITIYYYCHQPISSVLFSLSIDNVEGAVCLDTRTDEVSLPEAPSQESQSISLVIERLDLVQGNYFINVGIYSPDWETTFDFHWHKYPLTLINTQEGSGIVHPPMQWQLPISSNPTRI